MSLSEAGDISFIHWQKQFYCDVDHKSGIPLSTLIKESEMLELRFTDWEEKLTNFRSTNPVINYFSVKQCLFLQKNLFKLSKDLQMASHLPTQFYTLLRFFDHDVSLDNIKNAFKLSRSLINDDECDHDKWKKASIQSNFEKYSPDEIIGFVNTLQEIYEVSENVAWASIIQCFPYREGKAAIWCEKQDPESEAINELEQMAKEQLEHALQLNAS